MVRNSWHLKNMIMPINPISLVSQKLYQRVHFVISKSPTIAGSFDLDEPQMVWVD